MAKPPTLPARAPQTPLAARSVLQEESLALIEHTLGGREGLVAALTHAPKSRDLDYLLGLIGDPANRSIPLGTLCQQGGITPGELLEAWRSGEILRGHVLATKQVVAALPQVVADVVEKAAPYEGVCSGCQGVGQVTPEPTKKRPNPEPEVCPACQGSGRLLYPADLERARIVLDLAQLTPKGGGVNVLVDQRAVNVGGHAAAGGTLEALMAASDQILYGGGSAPTPAATPTASPADPPAILDADLIPPEASTIDADPAEGADSASS